MGKFGLITEFIANGLKPWILCVKPTGVAFVVGALFNVVFFKEYGFIEKVVDGVTKKIPQISVAVAGGNIDKIIPVYIEKIFPDWFSTLFSFGDVRSRHVDTERSIPCRWDIFWKGHYEKFLRGKGDTLLITRIGVAVTIILTAIWGLALPESIVSLATAFFFGLCSSSFLPVFVLGYLLAMYNVGRSLRKHGRRFHHEHSLRLFYSSERGCCSRFVQEAVCC